MPKAGGICPFQELYTTATLVRAIALLLHTKIIVLAFSRNHRGIFFPLTGIVAQDKGFVIGVGP